MTQESKTSSEKARHDWYQSDEYVNISIFIKNCTKETVQAEIKARSLSVNEKLPNSEFVLDFDPLAHEVVPEESHTAVYSTKIEIRLKKKIIGLKWGALEGDDSMVANMATVTETKPPTYPSSSKKSKDWASLEKSVEDEKAEGEAALNALFQKIYKDGSDEVKRAMMKSFVESGGTTLSTNWEEVGKESVPVRPPDGVVPKKWTE